MFKEKSSRKSKVIGALASAGAAAMLLSMSLPALATDTEWSRNLYPLGLETHVTSGTISLDGQRYHSFWLYSIQRGHAYLWVANSAGTPIGPTVTLPKGDGGTATTVFYNAAQSKGTTVNLRGKADWNISSTYATGRMNFG